MVKQNVAADFWLKVEKTEGCWLWTGQGDRKGYFQWRIDGRVVSIHRYAFELLVGNIPDGLEIDHKCHNEDEACKGGPGCFHRRCVRPDHLEAVSGQKNIRRARSKITQCPQGHEYSETNTIHYRGSRYCRACIYRRSRERDVKTKRWLGRAEYQRERRKRLKQQRQA